MTRNASYRYANITEKKKILTSRQMFQKLSIPLSQVKAGNTSKHLLNENRQMIY